MRVLFLALANFALIGTPVAADPDGGRAVQQVVDANSRRDIVRGLLTLAPNPDRLTDGHHYLITFNTRAKGVEIDEKLRLAFPQRMTVILQYDFLVVRMDPASFTLRLHFGGVPKLVTIPYDAVTELEDPSMGLHFVWEDPANERADPL